MTDVKYTIEPEDIERRRVPSIGAIRRFLDSLPRWNLTQVEPEEGDDGPLYDGLLTDPAGTLIRWEDIERGLARREAADTAAIEQWRKENGHE